jgi:hypothetical protein
MSLYFRYATGKVAGKSVLVYSLRPCWYLGESPDRRDGRVV